MAKCRAWTRARITCIFSEEPDHSDDEPYTEEEATRRLAESPKPLLRTIMISMLGEGTECDMQVEGGTLSNEIAPLGKYTTGWDWL